jgi:hypothetical protein
MAPVKSSVASRVPELPEEEPGPLSPDEEPEPEESLPDDAAPPDDEEVETVVPPSAGLLLEPEFPQAGASKSETPTMLAALRFMATASKDKK